jgi:hypothetical protein
LGRIALARDEERAGLQGQLRQRIVDATAALARPERARAVFFALEARRLHAVAWAGRPEPPQNVLARGDRGGEIAHRLLEGHERLLVPDTYDRKAEDLGLGGGYGTLLSVAVYAGRKNFGILSVDAPEPRTLDEIDVDIAAALAQTLGAGMAMT